MTSKLPLSVIILARNEEDNIGPCIESCLFADEILVINDSSTDRTVEIARSLGAKVIDRSMDGNWGEQQTFGIQSASHDWIFFIDADERVTPKLQSSIEERVRKNNPACFWIQRENHFAHGKATHGIMRPDWVARLMPKKDSYVEGLVHPKIVTPYKDARIAGRLIHFPYKSWDHYWGKFNKYTRLSAEKYRENGKQCSFFRDIILRPIWAFLKVYVFNLGFLDGKLGWIFSVNHYFYTMTKYVRLYALQKTNGKL